MAPPPLRRAGVSQVPAHTVTEDTPADMLTGQMSLSVLLPDGRRCKMNVDRGTPMMDLLIQVATANKISPGGHVIQVISDRSHSCLSYKPSTPIGTLDTTALRIVAKNKINELPSRRAKPPPQNPMADAKIRIKVYLPRNQLSAMRVSPKTPLAEVLDQICKDKNLDVSRYELRHPVNVDERLRPSCCLADYKLQEVTVVPLNSRTNTVLSSADIIAMQKKSDGKRKIFAIFGKKSKPSVIESTASSDSLGDRSVSPDGSDESADRPRSLSPQPPQVIQAPPRAKKRTAPKPPQINGSGTGRPPAAVPAAPAPAPAPVAARPPSELSEGAESVESRQSSDSSGYHEAGLSDAPDSPTERAPAPAAPSNLGSVSSYSTSNLVSSNLTQVNSTSTVSLSSAIRKRRAPPPPAIPRIAEDPQSPPTRAERASPQRQAPAPAPPAAAASVARQPVDQQPLQQQQQPSELAAPCSEGSPAAAGRVPPQPLRRGSLGAHRPQPLPRLLSRQLAENAADLLPPPPEFGDTPPPPVGAGAVRLRGGVGRAGLPRPASVGGRPSTLQRKKRAPAPPTPPISPHAVSLPASRTASIRETFRGTVSRAASVRDSVSPRSPPTPASRQTSHRTTSVDLTDVTSLSSFRSCWSEEDSEPARAPVAAPRRQQTLSSGDSDGSGGGRDSELAGWSTDGASEADRPGSPQCFVIHRWRNSTNLDQLVADVQGQTQEEAESKSGSPPGSACSTPERTPHLKAPLRQHSGTSSTETLTADPPAPAPAPAAAPSPTPAAETSRKPAPPAPVIEQPKTEAKPETDATQAPAPVETISQSATPVQNVDQSQLVRERERDSTIGSSEVTKPKPESEPDPSVATEVEPVPSIVLEKPAPVAAPVAAPVPPAAESPSDAAVQPPPPAEHPAPAVEDVQTRKPGRTPSPETTVEESLPNEVAPVREAAAAVIGSAPVVLEEPVAAAVPEPPTPTVTGTSAPVVLEAPAAVLEAPTPNIPEPTTAAPAAVSETLPTEPRQRDAASPPTPAAPATDSSSDLSSAEPSQTTDEEEDLETVRLQQEVDSALACLDNNLDEALAESAAFTESSNLQTQCRLPPPPETETETETEPEETTQETLPVVVRETPKVVQETPKAVREAPKAVQEAPKAVHEAPKAVQEAPKAVQEAPNAAQEAPKVVSTSRETVHETREVIETLLPVARVAAEAPQPRQTEPTEPRQSPVVPPAAAAVAAHTSQDKGTAVVADTQQKSAPAPTPVAEEIQEASLPEMARTVVGKSSGRSAPEEQRTEQTAPRSKRIPKLGPASRQRPVEVEEEVVVERVERVQRNRMTSKDIKLHIERKLASFDQLSQPGQLLSPPASAPAAGADSPGWEYRLPAPPTPFQDQTGPSAGRAAPLEAPLEFQDNMTVTSSEPSEPGELAEATNGPLMERVGQSEPAPPPADQSEPDPQSVDQWDGGRQPERPAKPERRRSNERLSRQMSFSIGAYGQREPGAAEGGAVGRLQKADSFHCQKSATQTGSSTQMTSVSESAGANLSGPEKVSRRAVTRRRSSDAADRPSAAGSRGQRSAETDRSAAGGAAEPVRPPRKYELKFNSSKSYSMLNLSNGGLTMPTERASPNMNKTQSQTDLAMESEVSDIQSEFLKLQRQFLHWQQQLLQNQSILQTKVAPLAARPAAASLQSLEVIEELRRRVPEQDPDSEPPLAPPADYASRSQSLPRGASLQHTKLSLAEQQREPEPREPEPERTPPRQRASTLERRAESQPEPEPPRQRASTLERRPSETREKRVPWSPPKVALGTWADQSRQSQVQLKEDRDYVLRQGPPPTIQQPPSEQTSRRSAAVSVRPSKSVTVTSLGAPPPPVGVPQPPQPPQLNGTQQRLSAVAKVRHNETVSAPTAVLPLSTAAASRGPSARQPPVFSISDSKPSQPGRSGTGTAAGRFTSVVSLTEEPRQPHTVSVQVSKPAGRSAGPPAAVRPTTRPAEPAAVTCRVTPPAQSQPLQRTVPSVVSVTRKDSVTSTELAGRQTAAGPGPDASWRNRHQPVVKGFRQSEVPAPVPPPPPPPAPVLPSAAAAGRARLKPVSGRPVVPKLDPREELMIAIREHGGLKKRGGVRP